MEALSASTRPLSSSFDRYETWRLLRVSAFGPETGLRPRVPRRDNEVAAHNGEQDLQCASLGTACRPGVRW